jgi:hypothetical protein
VLITRDANNHFNACTFSEFWRAIVCLPSPASIDEIINPVDPTAHSYTMSNQYPNGMEGYRILTTATTMR